MKYYLYNSLANNGIKPDVKPGTELVDAVGLDYTGYLKNLAPEDEVLNNPILGDPLYGTQKADRLYLHAETLSFDDPETGERRTFHYPAPF